MATGKQGFVRAAEPQHSVSMPRERELRIQAPLTAMYIQPVPGLPACSPGQPTAVPDAAVIPLSLPVICANQALPILTLHIAGGATVQQQRPETPVTSSRPKSAGKHVCQHCGRDCLKPSVLEKHLRCHTGERPYPCTTCGISFKTQSNLYKHKRTQAHARLSSESGKGAFSSQESTESLRETCSSPSSLLELQSESESSDVHKTDVSSLLLGATATTRLHSSVQQITSTEEKITSNTEWALRKAAVVGLIASPVHGQQEILQNSAEDQRTQLAVSDAKNEATFTHTKSSPAGDGCAPLTPNRTPLQRQEALFSKLSRGKSQSHDSTDSGFSESSEQHLTSTRDTLHESNLSLESLPEASIELQGSRGSNKDVTLDVTLDVAADDANAQKVTVQEKQKLEEHILKLISENSVLVDDKHLVNVRPRKTVLSKQGSIDLPMPYTYKDSFHFDIRSSKHQQVSSLQTPDRRGRVMYSSVPTQHSTSVEHAPLTRSSSLPFSVEGQNNDRTNFPYQGDSIQLSRRCSAGNIHPFKSVDQQGHGHRLLVRQVAVDCLSIAEGISTEKSCQSSLSSDGDCADVPTEPGIKRCRRKKAQKFAYNKWYMYGGGGTFKKLYSSEKDSCLLKGRKAVPSLEQTESQGTQISQQIHNNNSSGSLSSAGTSLPPSVNVFTAQTSSQVVSSYVLLQSPLREQTSGQRPQGLAKKVDEQRSDFNVEASSFKSGTEGRSPIPSERKKQKTENNPTAVMGNTDTLIRQKCVLTSRSLDVNANANIRDVISQSLQSVCGDVFPTSSKQSAMDRNKRLLNIHRQGSFNIPSTSNQNQTNQLLFKRHSSPLFGTNMSRTSESPSASSTISSICQTKSSFLPKYQLKIPCPTDGVSDPAVSKHSTLDQPSPAFSLQQSATNQQHDPKSALSKQENQSCTSITTTKSTFKSTTSVACPGLANDSEALTHNQPKKPYTSTSSTVISATPTPTDTPTASLIPEGLTTYSVHIKVGASTPSVLSQPLQTFTALGQNQSVVVGTSHSKDSSLSHSPTSTKPIHMLSSTTTGSAVPTNPATPTPVVISRELPGPSSLETNVPACQGSMELSSGVPLEISQTGFQTGAGAQFEGKMLLVNHSQSLAQDTFYVRTADLQIVMQLISDEQLALIEPQIEKQALSKMDGSCSFLNKDSEKTSLADTAPTGVSQGIIHKQQCQRPSDQTGTKLCLEQGNENLSNPSITQMKIPDLTQISAGLMDNTTGEEVRSTSNKNPCDDLHPDLHPQNTQNTHLTESCPKEVLKISGSASKQDIPIYPILAPMDNPLQCTRLLQQQSYTLLTLACEDSGTLKDPKLQEGCCQDTVDNYCGLTGTSSVSFSIPESKQGTKERGSTLLKENATFTPETFQVPETSKIIPTAGQRNPFHLTQGKTFDTAQAAEMEQTGTNAELSYVSEALRLHLTSKPTIHQPNQPNQEVPISVVQKKQLKSCWTECASSATEPRQMSPGSVLAHTASQYKPLNQRDVCTIHGSNLKHKAPGNQTFAQSQAPVHLSQQHCSTVGAEVTLSNREDDAALTIRTGHMTSAFLKLDTPVSETVQEERTECGEAQCGPQGVEPVHLDLFPGPRVGGSLQTSWLQRDPGTGSQGWVLHEPGPEGGDGVRDKCLELEDQAKENEKEGAEETHGESQTARDPRSHVSQPVTNACRNTSSAAELHTSSVSGSSSAAPALSRGTSLSHISTHAGQRACSHPDNPQHVKQNACAKTPKLIDQSEDGANKMERAPSQESFTLLSTGPSAPSSGRHLPPACGHLLAHPLLVNAIQKEVQKEKETQVKTNNHNNPTAGQHSSHARALQGHGPLSENKRDETQTISSPITTLSLSEADSSQTINTTPTEKFHIPNSNPCPNRTNDNNNALHFNPACASPAQHHIPTEIPSNLQLPQCHSGGSYLEEEESSSSSDDEGKLVIELE